MTFIDDYKWVILFYSGIVLLLYYYRNKFEKPASFIFLLRTKIGLNLMDKVSSKFRTIIKILGYMGVVLAYLGFFFVSYILVQSAFDLIIDKPGAVGGSPVIPGLPIAGLGIRFPLVIGWLSLFIIMVVHEFSHGIVARAYNVKVKSSGLAFFGPILGAFVEPDEDELIKEKHRVQHSIFAAGPVSNFVLWIVCSFLIIGVSLTVTSLAYPSGIMLDAIKNESLPAYNAGLPDRSIVTGINNDEVTNWSSFVSALDELNPGDSVIIRTKTGSYNMVAISNPGNVSQAFLGVNNFQSQYAPKSPGLIGDMEVKVLLWLAELLNWTGFISINIGLINLFPIFITDGARMLKLNFELLIKNKKRADSYWKNVNLAALVILLILVFLPLIRNMFNFMMSYNLLI